MKFKDGIQIETGQNVIITKANTGLDIGEICTIEKIDTDAGDILVRAISDTDNYIARWILIDDCERYSDYASNSYRLIKQYYGNGTAKRSGVPLINHIDEGIEILKSIGADTVTIDAYCLHPILQSDDAFNNNYRWDFTGIPTVSLLLAMEYRRVANSYLSHGKPEDFVGFTNERIKWMLYADKIQNEKDFRLYHEGSHPRSKELREYFDTWINVLLK